MPGRGPLPKAAGMRQRRNRVVTAARLEARAEPRRRRPPLPQRTDGQEWHPLAVQFWRWVWGSPMAGEYLQADMPGLQILVDLVDRYWRNPSLALAAEIRQQRTAFGLTPMDRRRLQWEVERVEGSRPRAEPVQDPQRGSVDPRRVLQLIGQ